LPGTERAEVEGRTSYPTPHRSSIVNSMRQAPGHRKVMSASRQPLGIKLHMYTLLYAQVLEEKEREGSLLSQRLSKRPGLLQRFQVFALCYTPTTQHLPPLNLEDAPPSIQNLTHSSTSRPLSLVSRSSGFLGGPLPHLRLPPGREEAHRIRGLNGIRTASALHRGRGGGGEGRWGGRSEEEGEGQSIMPS